MIPTFVGLVGGGTFCRLTRLYNVNKMKRNSQIRSLSIQPSCRRLFIGPDLRFFNLILGYKVRKVCKANSFKQRKNKHGDARDE